LNAAPDRPSARPSRSGEWLALGPASRLVGVDPDTLRRWANEGLVEVFLTPGGHRRFERAALERIRASRRAAPRSALAHLGATPERLSRAYRRSYAARRGPAVAVVLPGADREAFRDGGRRLVGALVRHLDAPDAEARHLAEAEAGVITDDVARRLALGGTALTEAVAQFVAARRPLLAEIGSLAARRGLDPASLTAVYQGASDLMDRLLVRLVASWLAASGSPRTDEDGDR